MKRIALRSTAALLTLAALGSTASAQAGGYMVTWSKTDTTPTATAKTERASSGYMVSWSKTTQTERASSGYIVSWTKTQPAD